VEITVFLDDKAIAVHLGARVKHLLLKAGHGLYDQARVGDIAVVDRWGNRVGMEGDLSPGDRLYLRPTGQV